MRKKLILVLAAVLVLALAVPALAAATGNQPASPLTADQAKELAAIQKQMLDLKKQMIDKLVEFGRLTPDQGDQAKQRITERQQYIEQNPGAVNWGNCPNYSGGCWGRGGRGGWGGFGGMMGPRGGYGGPWGQGAGNAQNPATGS
jgi:hypothetical protein